MTKITRLLAFALLSCSLCSYADQLSQSGVSSSPKKSIVRSKKTQSNKQEKKADTAKTIKSYPEAEQERKIGLEILGTPLSDFFLKYGARTFYKLGTHLQVGGYYLGGSEDLKKKFPSTSQVNVNEGAGVGHLGAAHARYFIGRSFSVQTGLGFRSATISFSASDNAGNSLGVKAALSGLFAPLAIGNHWMWSNGFTVGCDWVAAMLPLSGSVTSQISTNLQDTGELESYQKVVQDAGTKAIKSTTLTLGLISLGYVF